MKAVLPFTLLTPVFGFASTGSSQDDTLMYIVLISFLGVIYLFLNAGSYISKVKGFIRKRKMLSLLKKQHLPKDENPADALISLAE